MNDLSLEELRAEHNKLDKLVAKVSRDPLRQAEANGLKLKKLKLKDEIERRKKMLTSV